MKSGAAERPLLTRASGLLCRAVFGAPIAGYCPARHEWSCTDVEVAMVAWLDSIEVAIERAGTSGKLILVDFFSPT